MKPVKKEKHTPKHYLPDTTPKIAAAGATVLVLLVVLSFVLSSGWMHGSSTGIILPGSEGDSPTVGTGSALLTGQNHFEGTAIGWTSLLFQIFIVSFASYLVWCRLIKIYLAARLGILVFMTPIFGVILSVLLLGESVGLPFVAGSLMVFCGIMVVQRPHFFQRRRSS